MGHVHLIAAAAKSSGGFNIVLLGFVVIFAVIYFVMIRPQQRRRRELMQQQRQIQPGQQVRTTAGMYATVVEIDNADVVLEIAPGVKVRYMRAAIRDVVPSDNGVAAAGSGDADTAADDEAAAS
jgi:preprotein translocase subunit YajC